MTLHREGDIVFKAEPWIYTVNGSCVDEVCYRCLVNPRTVESAPAGKPLARCSGCKFARYCSKKCQKEDWKDRHQPECRTTAEVVSKLLDRSEEKFDVFRLVCQIMIGIKRGQSTNGYDCQPPAPLTSEDLSPNEKTAAQTQGLRAIYQEYRPYFAKIDAQLCGDYRSFVRLYAKFLLNGTPIDDYIRNIGRGVHLGLNTFSHSCDPNTMHVFDGKIFMLKAVRDIAVDDQVTLARGDVFAPAGVRQAFLKRLYFIDCHCPVCTDPDLLAVRHAAKCKSEECAAAIPLHDSEQMLLCPVCKRDNTVRIHQAKKMVTEILSHPVGLNKPLEPGSISPGMLAARAEDLLHPTNFLLGFVYDQISLYCNRTNQREGAYLCVEKALPAIREHCSKYDKHLSSALCQIFNVLWDKGQEQDRARLVAVGKELLDIYRFALGTSSKIYEMHRQRCGILQKGGNWKHGIIVLQA